MKNKLSGAYRYTYKQIKNNIAKHIKKDETYKSAMQDLYEMFYGLELNQSAIPSEFLNSSQYAKSIEESLNTNQYHTLIRTSLIVVSTILGAFTSIFGFSAIIANIPPLYTPIIEMNDHVVSWDPIENADFYRVFVDEEYFDINETSYEFIPEGYGNTRIGVIAMARSIFKQSSRMSNYIYYLLDGNYQSLDRPINTAEQIVSRTNELGEVKLDVSIMTPGYHELVFGDYMDLSKLSVDIEVQEQLFSFGQNETVGLYFRSAHYYRITIRYLRDTEIEFILTPNKVQSSQIIELAPMSHTPLEFVSPIVNEAFIVLSDYDPNVYIQAPFGYTSITGLTHGRLVWMQKILFLYNNAFDSTNVQLITKTPTPIQVNQNYVLNETNQVQMLKIVESQFPVNKMLYIEFDSDYYDIFFMDHFQRAVDFIKLESDFDRYTIPIFFDYIGYGILYITLVPKDEKVSGNSRIKVNTSLPDGMTFWPHY